MTVVGLVVARVREPTHYASQIAQTRKPNCASRLESIYLRKFGLSSLFGTHFLSQTKHQFYLRKPHQRAAQHIFQAI